MTADVTSLMVNSFKTLFGVDHQVADEDLPSFAHNVRWRGLVKAEHQHRWLLMGRALQQRIQAQSEPAIACSTLRNVLDYQCDSVEQMLNDVYEGDAQCILKPSYLLAGNHIACASVAYASVASMSVCPSVCACLVDNLQLHCL